MLTCILLALAGLAALAPCILIMRHASVQDAQAAEAARNPVRLVATTLADGSVCYTVERYTNARSIEPNWCACAEDFFAFDAHDKDAAVAYVQAELAKAREARIVAKQIVTLNN